MVFIPSKPQRNGTSAKTNIYEAEIVGVLVGEIYKCYGEQFNPTQTLGIITPYRSQIALIKKELAKLSIPAVNDIVVDTVERFQGSERDVIIYSFSVNYLWQLKFLANVIEENGKLIDRKLNVALTRARKQLFITGVPDLLRQNSIYSNLLNLIDSCDGFTDLWKH